MELSIRRLVKIHKEITKYWWYVHTIISLTFSIVIIKNKEMFEHFLFQIPLSLYKRVTVCTKNIQKQVKNSHQRSNVVLSSRNNLMPSISSYTETDPPQELARCWANCEAGGRCHSRHSDTPWPISISKRQPSHKID